MGLLTRINPYWLYIKIGAAAIALAGMWWWGYSTKAMACDLAAISMENAQLQAQRAEIEFWRKQAIEADEALREALERPQAAPVFVR